MLLVDFNKVVDLCIPIVASILSIALPIIVQTISKIDEHYNSIRLIKRFKNELVYWLFQGNLGIAIILLIYNNIVFLPWKRDGEAFWNNVMSNSSNILLIIFTVVLIVFLFLLINLIIRYYDYQKLFTHIKNRLYSKNGIKDVIKEKDARDLIELGKYIIRKDDNEIAKDFYQFLYDFVTEKNRDKSFKSVEYDNWLYNAVLSLNDIVCRENIRPISIANSNDILKLLIPNRPEYIISDTTYLVLWRTLQQQLFYDKTNYNIPKN